MAKTKWIPYPCDICGKTAFHFASPMPPGVQIGEIVSAKCEECVLSSTPSEKIDDQLAQCQERLAVAEGLLNRNLPSLEANAMGARFQPWPSDAVINHLESIVSETKTFLSHAPGEYVAVRREDVSLFVKWFETRINEHYAGGTMTEIINRFKAALESKI